VPVKAGYGTAMGTANCVSPSVTACQSIKRSSSANKMQSEAADFAPGPPPGELDEEYAPSLIQAYSLHSIETVFAIV